MIFNFAFYLSLVLAAMGCGGLLLAGKGKWYGWGIGLAVQPVWVTYAIVTHGYGLIITSFMYGFVYSRNIWRWRREARLRNMLETHPDRLNWMSASKPVGYMRNMSEDSEGITVEWTESEGLSDG